MAESCKHSHSKTVIIELEADTTDYFLPGFYESQTWGALDKAWLGYVIAKNKGEDDKLVLYTLHLILFLGK